MDCKNTSQDKTNELEPLKSQSLTGGLTQEELRRILDYDPETGLFTWKISPRPRTSIGDIAGSPDRGYIRIQIQGYRYDGHVLAWFYAYGEITLVDHEDRRGFNNKLSNLRKASWAQNNHNRAAYNRLGVKGVYQDHNRYYSRIAGIYLGSYETIEEAKAVYDAAAKYLYDEFADDN